MLSGDAVQNRSEESPKISTSHFPCLLKRSPFNIGLPTKDATSETTVGFTSRLVYPNNKHCNNSLTLVWFISHL